jgi:hypothetical protein
MKRNSIKATIAGAALAAGLGGVAFAAHSANAAQTAPTPSTATADPAAPAQPAPTASDAQPDPTKSSHVANGITETLLTGDNLTKATAAVKAADSTATIQRIETDADGDAFEAHIVKADGTPATIKFDASFNITKTETGGPGGGPGGPGGRGHRGPGANGQAPAAPAATTAPTA